MEIKAKFAAILRRWASKLSPDNNPFPPDFGLRLPSPTGLGYYEVKRLCSVLRSFSRRGNKSPHSTATKVLPRRGKAYA